MQTGRALVIGIVIGAAVTTAGFQLRGRPTCPTVAASSTGSLADAPGVAASDPSGSHASAASAIGSSATRSEPAAPAAATPPATTSAAGLVAEGLSVDRGLSSDDGWWASLPPNPAWDAPRAATVLDRIAKLGVKLPASAVECKRRCCRIVFDTEVFETHGHEITSSVGLDFEPGDGSALSQGATSVTLTKCWQPGATDKPLPDRAVERAALLAKVRGELERCGRGTSPAITLELWLGLDEAGQIAKVDSNAKQLGQKAAACAETAILAAANFARSAAQTQVPITVVLGK